MGGTVQATSTYVYELCLMCPASIGDVLVYECHDQNGEVRLLCADHTRKHIAANPQPHTCEQCGKAGKIVQRFAGNQRTFVCTSCMRLLAEDLAVFGRRA